MAGEEHCALLELQGVALPYLRNGTYKTVKGFEAQVLKPFEGVPSSFGRGLTQREDLLQLQAFSPLAPAASA